MSTYTPTADDLDSLSALFDVSHEAGIVPMDTREWRDYCAGTADLYDRIYWCLMRTVEYPPLWQRMALLSARDHYAERAEDLDR